MIAIMEKDNLTLLAEFLQKRENIDPALLQRGEVSFDGEDTESRLARRTRGWIPSVRFVTPAADAAREGPALRR